MIKQEIYRRLKDLIKDEIRVKQIVLSSSFTGVVLDNEDMGMAMNVRSGCNADARINDFLRGKVSSDGLAVAADLLESMDRFKGYADNHILMHSVLVALYNALSKPYMNEEYLHNEGCGVEFGIEEAPSSAVKSGETVTIVGFGGMVRPLSEVAGKIYVTELEPSLFSSTLISAQGVERGPNCCTLVPAELGKEYFKRSDTIFVTGSTLVTDTIDKILEQCSGKNVIVYGMTAGFLPQPLLERGVKKIRTSVVKDTDLMVSLLLNCAGAVERFFPMATESMIITSTEQQPGAGANSKTTKN